MRLALAATFLLAACAPGPTGPTTESGALENGDLTLSSGEFFDPFTVRVSEGQWISVEVTAEGFDPYLIVRSPSGPQSDTDDSETGNTASTRSVVQATEAGRWDVIVTSYAPGEMGSYTVTYEVTDVMPASAAATDSTVTV